MADLVNEFSWSMSRAAKFDACPRAYYYHYYGAWGGWEPTAPPETRELYLLKKLTTRQAWAGTAVHDTIAWALARAHQGHPLPTADQAVGRMHLRMRQEFRESRAGEYRVRRALGLMEHEYQEPLEDTVWADIWEHARRCLEAFFGAPILQDILAADPADWFPIDALDTFSFQATKVYVAPDFAFRDRRGRLRILDWKTGVPKDRDRDQVRGYVLFALDRWQARLEDLQAELHYLGRGEVLAVDVTDAALDRFRDEMRASMQAMRACLVDVEANRARPEDFPPSARPDACLYCNFRRACPDADRSAAA